MPYKLSKDKKTVLVKRGERWEPVPGGEHETPAEARKHLAALKANVKHVGRRAAKPAPRKPKGGRKPKAKARR